MTWIKCRIWAVRGRIAAALVLASVATPAAIAQRVPVGQSSIVQTVTTLKAGEYVWAPQAAPQGPMLLVVNVTTQRAMLYRNGVPIAASTVSTGKPGYSTPTGVFTILQRNVEHYSAKYNNAPMPYMQRLTWGGVALHAGNLPGYPASHGCIRLPYGFAKLLYGLTKLGMTVVITSAKSVPRIGPAPEIATRASGGQALPPGAYSWHPERSASGPVSIVVSGADRRAVVLRNGVEIGSASVTVDGGVAGTWAYTLRGVDAQGQHWMHVDLGNDRAEGKPVESGEWQRFHAPVAFKRAIAEIVAPGTTVVVTSDSLNAGSTSTPLTVIDAAKPR